MPDAKKPEYEVVHERVTCAHVGIFGRCPNVITHYAVKKGERGGPVWCREHRKEAWTRAR